VDFDVCGVVILVEEGKKPFDRAEKERSFDLVDLHTHTHTHTRTHTHTHTHVVSTEAAGFEGTYKAHI
jgi:hypothetical protein